MSTISREPYGRLTTRPATQGRADPFTQPHDHRRQKNSNHSGTTGNDRRKNPSKNPSKTRTIRLHRPTPKEQSDLAQFYEARAKTEREERQQEEQRQREIAARRKQTREQVATLINENQQNVDDAEIRYNFVVGENIKYLYVTEAQQQDLADGKLAITFLGGKRCLIPLDTAQQILALDPDKLIVINTPEAETA